MIRLYTDGACGKDGVGGWSWVLTNKDEYVTHDWGAIPDTTNNRMELHAVIAGLDFVPTNFSLTVVSDSAYVINCFLERWYEKWIQRDFEKVKNPDLWKALLRLVENRDRFAGADTSWEHVRGHNGDRWNEKCDEWAVAARKGV